MAQKGKCQTIFHNRVPAMYIAACNIGGLFMVGLLRVLVVAVGQYLLIAGEIQACGVSV